MIHNLRFRHSLAIVALAIFMFAPGLGRATNLINENIQSWTSHASYGNYTQAITAGTVNMTACIVAPSGAASGTGSIGYVQMQATTGILALPTLSSAGTAEFHIHAGGAGRTLKLQSYNGSTWVDLTTFTIGATGATFTYAVNSGSSATLRLSTPSAAVYVHDIIISDYAISPVINVTGSFSAFTTIVGTPSASQSVAVSGSNLTNTIEVAALSGYEYSTSSSGPWTSTLSLASSFNGNVYVRLTGASVGSYNGNVSFSSTGATPVNKAVLGTVNPLTPVINVTGSFTAFSTTLGTPSASQSVAVSGSNLTAGIDISAVAEYEYSTTNAAPWTSTLSLASSYSGNVYVRLTGASLGLPAGTISFSSAGATQVDKAVSGSVTVPPPVITVTGTFSAFTATAGTPSASQSVAVSVFNLTAGLGVSAVTGYEYSTTNGDPWTSTLSLSSTFSGNVYVRLTGAASGTFTGNVSFTSTGATQVDKAVSGTVACAAAAFPFVENFDYTASTLLSANCWNVHSTGANPITVATSSISYPGYLSSGIGNEITLVTGTGEDVNRTFTAQTSGVLYASFLVNVSSATTTGDYFFHIGQSVIGTSFKGRIFVKKDALNNIAFGIAQSTTSANYTAFSYALNTTYLVVLKYSIVSGTANDIASIYINPALNAAEPVSGWITNTDAAGTDLTEVGTVALRQGGATSDPALKLDGIRVSNTWADIVGALPQAASTFTGTGNWGDLARWSNGLPGAITNVTISGTATITSLVECNNCTISSNGALTVNTGTGLIVDGNLLIQSGGSFISEAADLDVIGSTTVERYITGNGWHLISSPVAGATAEMFTGKYLQKHDEYFNAYSDVLDINEALTPMKGFALWGDASGFTASYAGSLNTGTQSYSTTYSGVGKGWNLVGNPYPSAIDFALLSRNNVNNAFYVHISNSSWGVYGAGVSSPDVTVTQYIASGQGFFVQASAAGSLSMANTARVHNSIAFHKKSVGVVNNLIRLTVSGNGYTDEAVVRFVPEATAAFDGEFDAHKLYGDVDEAAQLYTLGTTPLAINALPETDAVPVGVHVGANGVYTIAATEVNNIPEVTLEDTKTGIYTDLLKGSYSFSFTPGENEQRFMLHFGPLAVNNVENSFANIYSNSHTVYIDMKDNMKGNIFVYNMTGQLVAKVPASQGRSTINLANTGNYIVKVICDKSTMVKKVFIQ